MVALPARPVPATLALLSTLMLAACGGGGTSSSGSATSGGGTGGTVVVPTQCSLRDRQLWAEAQIREWYLFPEDLPASLDPAPYASVDAYIDALTANARALNKDRYFTYITSITAENAFINSGQTAAFGFRASYDSANRTVTLLDAFETGPAFAAGLDRGARITAIGDTPSSLVSVNDLFARGGSAAVADALGPSTAGVTRTIRYVPVGGSETTVTITKADFNIPPVSPRFGTKIIDQGGQRYGYVNLRSFISTAETPLRTAFAQFRAAGVDRVIIDFRYNGGGLVRIAELMGDLMGRNRLSSDVYSRTVFRPSKSSENLTRLFRSTTEAIAPDRLAFITTGSSASASELVINSMMSWTRGRIAMVGANTSGKPVGQIAIDRTACDDRLRIVAFATQNADGDGDYYTGLKSVFDRRGERTCAAIDTPAVQMGEPGEGSTGVALSFLSGASCTAFADASGLTAAAPDSQIAVPTTAFNRLEPLPARNPSPAQRDMPGLF